MPVCVVPIFILKVCYQKGHLLEKGEVVEEEKWGQRLRGLKRSKRSGNGSHIFGPLFCLLHPQQNDLVTLT